MQTAYENKEKTLFFDSHADTWDTDTYDAEQRLKIRRIIADMPLFKNQDILDVGCGTGILVPLIREKIGEKGKLIGLDISKGMLKTARRKYRQNSPHLICACAESIPLKNECIDATLCFSVFPHFNHHPRALKELLRVVRNDGKLYIIHLEGSETLNSFHKNVGGAVRHDKLPDASRMQSLLKKCGWMPEHVRDDAGGYFVEALKRN